MIRLAAVNGEAKADERLRQAHEELGRLIESGECTGVVVLYDGPGQRDVLVAGDIDLDAMTGFSFRVFGSLAGMAE